MLKNIYFDPSVNNHQVVEPNLMQRLNLIQVSLLFCFDLPVIPMLRTKFESTGLSILEKKRKIDFQDDLHSSHLVHCISDRNDFSIFLSISHPGASYQVWSQLAFRFRSKVGGYGGHLGFPIGTILANFNLQVTTILPTKFQLAQGCKRSRLLKQLLTPHATRRSTADARHMTDTD